MSRKHFLLLPALALALMGQAKAPDDIYVYVPHGSFPKITKHEVEGQLPKTGDHIGALFRLHEPGWEVTVTRGGRHRSDFNSVRRD
jgi:hypothetical protein